MQIRSDIPRFVQMIAGWLVAFPTITALLVLLAPLISDWPIFGRTFVLSILMAPIMTIATPVAVKLIRARLADDC